MTDAPQAWPRISVGLSILLCVWLVALAGVATVNVLLLARGESLIANPPDDLSDWLLPGETLDAPLFYNRWPHYAARAITGLSVMATAVVISATLYAIAKRRANPTTLKSLRIAILLGLMPVVIRMLLPWENPWTGAGSPAATCMSLPFIAAIFGLPIAIPARNFIRALRPYPSGNTEPKPSSETLSLPTPLDQL